MRSILLLVLIVALPAAAQMPASAPAPPDTALATFSWASPAAAPSAITIWPSEAMFGQELVLILDHADGLQPQPLDSLRVDVPWIELLPAPVNPGDVPLPPSEGPRQMARLRIYREGPWLPRWQDGPEAAVQVVSGRVDDPAAVEPVRDPRGIGGLRPWVLILVAVLLLLGVAMLVWWRWRVRRHRWEPAHRRLEPPAWLVAAVALRDLDGQSLLAREYLDGLAGVLRRYLHGRFFIAAEEMTAPEILMASRRAGWRAGTIAGFAELLATCDDVRYAPDRVGSQDVQAALCRALDLIERVRILPVWTPVAPAELAAAKTAWEQLRQRCPASTSDEERTAC